MELAKEDGVEGTWATRDEAIYAKALRRHCYNSNVFYC